MNNRIGEVGVTTNGEKIKIVEYYNSQRVIVEFEDGSRSKEITYNHFKTGMVRHPSNYPESRIGESVIQNNGEKATIIEYFSSNNISVLWEDGTKTLYKKYSQFKNGKIDKKNGGNRVASRVGEKKKQNNGLVATIIEYINSENIVVEFEDGVRVNSKYYNFKNGKIGNKNVSLSRRIPNSKNGKRITDYKLMNNGLYAKVIGQKKEKGLKYVVEFEDGYTTEVHYVSFYKGEVGHPMIRKNRTDYDTYVLHFAYKENNKVFYNFFCKKCGYEDILTPQEVLKHSCLENIKCDKQS